MLQVGATPQVIETLLAAFLVAYRRRHPGVEVRLVEDGGARLPGRLERGHVQLALMPAGDARFAQRALAPVYVLAVMSRGTDSPVAPCSTSATSPMSHSFCRARTSARARGSTRPARWRTSTPA